MSRNVILGVLACVALAVGCATKEAAERDQPGSGEPVPATVPNEASKTGVADAGAATTTDALGTTGSAGTGAGPSSAADLGSATDAGTAVSSDTSGTATGTTASTSTGPADAGTTTRATADAGTSTRATADAGTSTRSTADAGTRTVTADAGTSTSTSTSTGSTPGSATAATVAAPDKKTERLWKAKCASCHGSDGKGQTEQGRKMQLSDMSQPKWQAARTDARLKKVILEGWDQTVGGVKQQMPGYKDELTPEQIDALVKYTRWVGQR